MAATLSPDPVMQFFDTNGNPLVCGKLYSYAAGTSTPLATYTDSTGATPNANPVILNARGEASVWLGASAYKLVLKDKDGVQIWSVDGISSPTAAATDLETRLAAATGSSLVGHQQVGGSVTTVQAKLRQDINLLDFGADPTGVADCTTPLINAIAAAKNASGVVSIPKGKYKITTGNISLNNITLRGSGTYEKATPYDDGGSVFLLTSTTVTPFNLGSAVTLSGLNFFYPGQTGAAVSPVVFPPLFAGTFVTAINIDGCSIINAYTGFKFNTTSGAAVGDFRMSGCRVYCVDTVFHFLVGAPEIINITDCLFSLGVYEDVANVSPFYLRNYTAANGRFMFIDVAGSAWVSVDGLTMSGSIVFGYRYGVVVRSGMLSVSNFNNNKFDAVGTAFLVDSTAQAQSCNFTSNLFYCYIYGNANASNAGLIVSGAGAHSTLVLVGNEFAYCQGSAVVIEGTDVIDEAMIVGNKFKSWGINSSGAATEYFAISLNDATAPAECLIVGNQFKGNGTKPSGIITATVTGLLLEANYFISCYNPIAIGAGSSNVRIYGNTTKYTIQASPVTISTSTPGAVEMIHNSWDKVPTRYAYPLVKSVLSSTQTFNSGTAATITTGFGTEIYDEDNNWNPTTGIFTAPTAGFYSLAAFVSGRGNTTSDQWKIFATDGTAIVGYVQIVTAGALVTWTLSAKFKLVAGGTIRVQVMRASGTGTFTLEADADITWVSIEKVQ